MGVTARVLHGWWGQPASRVALHLPERAGLGVVICPPLGQEGIIAYRALRLLGTELAAGGVAAVRYDPPGHGDAAPCDDPHAPIEGARAAAELLRSAGCTQVAFVGLASAALVAASAVAPGDHLVLWDAPASGRAWLRRQRSLAAMSLGASRLNPDDIETLIGLDLDPGQAKAIGSWRLRPAEAGRTLWVTRTGTDRPELLAAAEELQVEGMAEFIDCSSIVSRLPGSAVGEIAGWLVGAGAGDHQELVAPDLDQQLELADGTTELISRLGPHRLFAIQTVPAGADPNAGPVVVLHNGASEHRAGPADYQVRLARALARDQVAAVRFDRRGTGETGPISATQPDLMYTSDWVDDQHHLLAALGRPGDQVAVAGMCAGAWLAAYSADLDPRLVVEISPRQYSRRLAQPDEFIEIERGVADVSSGRQWLRDQFNRWAPAQLRLALAKSGGGVEVGAHLELVAGIRRTVLIMSELDEAYFDAHHGQQALRHLPSVELVRVSGGDHSLFTRTMRLAVISEVCRLARESFLAADA